MVKKNLPFCCFWWHWWLLVSILSTILSNLRWSVLLILELRLCLSRFSCQSIAKTLPSYCIFLCSLGPFFVIRAIYERRELSLCQNLDGIPSQCVVCRPGYKYFLWTCSIMRSVTHNCEVGLWDLSFCNLILN